jgi:hypothetical protein
MTDNNSSGHMQQSIGLLNGRFEGLSSRVDRLQADMSDQNVKLDKILAGVNRARGGIWILTGLGGIAASVGAGVHALLQYFHVGGPPP